MSRLEMLLLPDSVFVVVAIFVSHRLQRDIIRHPDCALGPGVSESRGRAGS